MIKLLCIYILLQVHWIWWSTMFFALSLSLFLLFLLTLSRVCCSIYFQLNKNKEGNKKNPKYSHRFWPTSYLIETYSQYHQHVPFVTQKGFYLPVSMATSWRLYIPDNWFADTLWCTLSILFVTYNIWFFLFNLTFVWSTTLPKKFRRNASQYTF